MHNSSVSCRGGEKVEREIAQSRTPETCFTPEITCCSALVDLMNPSRYKFSCFGPYMVVWAFRRREITVNTAGRGLDSLCLDTNTAYLEQRSFAWPWLPLWHSQLGQSICTICAMNFSIIFVMVRSVWFIQWVLRGQLSYWESFWSDWRSTRN